uniref:Uncharacterized protein n=1 Tax=Candidatus Kentrum sp. SD TaxID=2126332 RepID=A0A450YWE9_9GAMM|nr:MAG: hypothetical protein BECKSD772F_GA0070984_106113 [Candidatus Kentron sp. SD]VFK45860.1 MAG: hypothetical protein BECKSD772E_GA0070983_106213 [Candidatus Kentron sp. SD]
MRKNTWIESSLVAETAGFRMNKLRILLRKHVGTPRKICDFPIDHTQIAQRSALSHRMNDSDRAIITA